MHCDIFCFSVNTDDYKKIEEYELYSEIAKNDALIDYVINNDATQEELCKYVKEFAETINTSREPLANKFKVKYKDNCIIIDDAETFFSNARLRIENGDLDLSEYDFFWARANDIIAPLTDIEQLFYVSSGKIIIRLEEVFDYHC